LNYKGETLRKVGVIARNDNSGRELIISYVEVKQAIK